LLPELHNGGIFNWMLEGRRKYFEDQGFDYKHDDIPNTWNKFVDNPYKKNVSDVPKDSKETNESEKPNKTIKNYISDVVSDDNELNKLFGRHNSYTDN